MTITTSVTSPTGTYSITITGTGGGLTRTTTYSLTVTLLSPTVSTNAATSIISSSATLNGNITDTGGQNADLRGFDWGTSSGNYTASWVEGTSGNYQYGLGVFSDNLTSLSVSTAYYFRAKAHNSAGWGYGGELSFTTLTPTFNFSLSVNPTSGSVNQGGSVSAAVTATLTAPPTQSVSFSCSGLPTGASCSFSPTSCSPTCNSTMNITTLSTTPTGTYTTTITGTGGGLTRTTNYSLTVTTPNQPPTATNLSLDSPNSADYCGTTGYPSVRLRWQFSDPGDTQSAYQIQVDNNSNFSSPEVDTGKVISSSQAFLIQPPYPTLSWNTSYYWRLKVWDSQDTSSNWVTYQDNLSPPESFITISHSYPYLDLTFSPSRPKINEIVTFTDNSKCYSVGNLEYDCKNGGANILYKWDFTDDGIVDSTLKGNATTTYLANGNYTVRLTITDNSLSPSATCDATRQVTVRVRLPDWREVPP
jgi:hypothetical protein